MSEQLTNKVNDIINYIRNNNNLTSKEIENKIVETFPKEEYQRENIYQSTDFYIEDKTSIYLSKINDTKIIIDYPSGDRFGGSLSDPFTDIYLEFPINEESNRFYLFKDNKINDNDLNQILNHLEDIGKELPLSKNYVLSQINNCEESYPATTPYYMLERCSDEVLKDDEVKKAVIELMKTEASEIASEFYDQYMYGRYGGEDVDENSMRNSQQFINIKLPDNVSNLYKDDIKKTYYLYPDVQKELLNELKYLNSERIKNEYIIESMDLLRSYFEDRIKLSEINETLLAQYDSLKHYSLEQEDNFNKLSLQKLNMKRLEDANNFYKGLKNNDEIITDYFFRTLTDEKQLNQVGKAVDIYNDIIDKSTKLIDIAKKYKFYKLNYDYVRTEKAIDKDKKQLNNILSEFAKNKIEELEPMKKQIEKYNKGIDSLKEKYIESDKEEFFFNVFDNANEFYKQLLTNPSNYNELINDEIQKCTQNLNAFCEDLDHTKRELDNIDRIKSQELSLQKEGLNIQVDKADEEIELEDDEDLEL